MAVMERKAWNDERLDDLSARMDRGFDEVKGEVRELRKEMNARFTSGDARFNSAEARFNSVEARFNSIEARLDSLNRSLVIGLVSMTASIVGALLVTQL
jgi:predicted nuclease with TOPRIM domain